MLNFDNTQIAFQSKSDAQLRNAYYLFKLVGSPGLVKLGKGLLTSALKLRLPVTGLIKRLVFHQFAGGVSISDCMEAVGALDFHGVNAYLAYSVEGEGRESSFDGILKETLATILTAGKDRRMPFTVFKPTAFIPTAILEKINFGRRLSPLEESEKALYEERIDSLCRTAHQQGVPILVDAEESYYQDAIDELTFAMMKKYNSTKAIVFNTFQMYRRDRLDFLKKAYSDADAGNYFLGVKLVRGAYMEKERIRAQKEGYQSPIQPDKASTDNNYNNGLEFIVTHLDRIYVLCGSHNAGSIKRMTDMMAEKGIEKKDPRIYFGQLYGMSDHLTFNIAHAGYNVVKYVPYGPVKEVIPYLIRRAEENTSVAGQTGRELSLIMKERKRRKSQRG